MRQSSAGHTGSNPEAAVPPSPVAGGATQCRAMQENIKDKLSGIPIDVSVEIQDTKRKRRQSSFSQLPPVLDANVNNMVRSMVRARFQTRHGEFNNVIKPKQKYIEIYPIIMV